MTVLNELEEPVFLKPKDLLSRYAKPEFRLSVMFFFMLEKDDLDDLLRMIIPSTAKTAVAMAKNNRVAVILVENDADTLLRFLISIRN
jgi:hypothetical protein